MDNSVAKLSQSLKYEVSPDFCMLNATLRQSSLGSCSLCGKDQVKKRIVKGLNNKQAIAMKNLPYVHSLCARTDF